MWYSAKVGAGIGSFYSIVHNQFKMGVYYYLRNNTKKQEVHLDHHVKIGPITMNEAVHFAFINYMMENIGDTFQILSDLHDREEYEDVDLLKYEFAEPGVIEMIVQKLKKV